MYLYSNSQIKIAHWHCFYIKRDKNITVMRFNKMHIQSSLDNLARNQKFVTSVGECDTMMTCHIR